MENLSVSELQEFHIPFIIDYWLNADTAFLEGMGVDLSKMPSRQLWEESLLEQLRQPIPEKKSYCIIWHQHDHPIGHSNINKIVFGQEAYMHLHLWQSQTRQKGMGETLVRMTLPFFFENYQLQTLFCEPYALNPAPNKTLAKVGFQFLETYITTPGWLNFEQAVNKWAMTRESYQSLL